MSVAFSLALCLWGLPDPPSTSLAAILPSCILYLHHLILNPVPFRPPSARVIMVLSEIRW